jgi:Tfp pilus assembly protein PilZ
MEVKMNHSEETDPVVFSDKRKSIRKKISLPVRYCSDNKINHLGYMHDISNGGFFLKTRVRHEIGDYIQADIDVEMYSQNKIVRVHGKVVHASEKGIGVNFTFFDRLSIERIIDLAKV